MRVLFPLAALAICTAAIAKSAENEVRFAPEPAWAKLSEPLPVPDDARGLVFIRRQNLAAHLEANGQVFFTSSLIRILHPNGLQLGNVAIQWIPAAGKPVIHAVRIHRNGTVRDVLSTTRFEVLRREDQLEAAILDGTLTATLRIPDLRVGDDLELSYSVPGQDPTLGKDSFGILFLNEVPAPGRFSLQLSWEQGQEPKIQPTADLAGSIVRAPGMVTYTVDMPAALKPPKDAPPRYSWQRVLAFSDFADWQSVSTRFAPLFGKAATLPAQSAVRQEAAEIAAAHSDPRQRAAAALKLVQQQVRYVYVGLGGGNYTPASAEETWQRRYGDCKGKTALLLALLNELGIEAEAVLVNNAGNDDGLDQRLPSPAFFDHVLVRARIGGETLWLDGTLPHVAAASPSPLMPYRWVLPLSKTGTALEQVAWKPAARPDSLVLLEIDAREGFEAPARRTMTMIARGPAAIAGYNELSALTDEQMLSEFKRELEGDEDWLSIDKVTWRFDVKSQASVMEVSGTTKLEWDSEGKNSRSLLLPSAGFSPPYRRQRSASQDQGAPFYKAPEYTCTITTLRLPKGTAEKDWSFNDSYFVTYFGQAFLRSFERRDGSIRIVRSNRTLSPEVDAKTAATDNERIAKFDNSKGQIFYDLNSADMKKQTAIVPATYELDWLADDSPCLAPKKRA